MPVGLRQSSVSAVLPTITASLARMPARQAASASAGTAVRATAAQPAVVGTPTRSMASLTATRSAPGGAGSKRRVQAVSAGTGRA